MSAHVDVIWCYNVTYILACLYESVCTAGDPHGWRPTCVLFSAASVKRLAHFLANGSSLVPRGSNEHGPPAAGVACSKIAQSRGLQQKLWGVGKMRPSPRSVSRPTSLRFNCASPATLALHNVALLRGGRPGSAL
eukprot:214562-Chlamydomonas_euryale.AAC.7